MEKTHRLASKIWFFGGLAGLLISFFLTKGGLAVFLFSTIGLMTLIPVVYSYLEYQKIKK